MATTTGTVHLVWRRVGTGGRVVIAVCSSRAKAVEVVGDQVRWVEDYHGPHYPVTWKNRKLFEPLPRGTLPRRTLLKQTQYGDEVWIEVYQIDVVTVR